MDCQGKRSRLFIGTNLAALFIFIVLWSGCGGGSTGTGSASTNPGSGTPTSGGPASGAPSGGSTVPAFGHVFLLVEENHSYEEVIGNTSTPYLNSLASQYGLATQFFANAHPSIGNYFMLTTGQLETNDDAFAGTITDDNIVRELVKAGKSWHCYAESLPSIGYIGGDSSPYLKHHNPFAYFSDVVSDSTQAPNIVPFSQFASDLAANSLPNFSFIVPNVLDDAHNGTLSAADLWLQQNIQQLIASPLFQSDGLLIITFDESEQSDIANGGGHVATLIISAKAKQQFQSQTLFQHQSILRLVIEALGMQPDLGATASAPDMNEFF